MNKHQVEIAARLDGVYGVLRKLQAIHDGFETKCIGAGNCCNIGLRISLAECWNIARNIRRQYWIKAEDIGTQKAEEWYQELIGSLKDAFNHADWSWNDEDKVETKCAFFSNGCSIYEYRPAICRAYGVITPVQIGVCPRPRLSDGTSIEVIATDDVERAIDEFDSIIARWDSEFPDLGFSIYMPAGVLRFLLPEQELRNLIENTDEKYWQGTPGYQHRMHKKDYETETEVSL